MTNSTQATQARPISPSRSSSTSTFHPTTANTSTSSLTLVETNPTNNNNTHNFSAPPRTSTNSSTGTNSTITSHSTTTRTVPSQAAILRAREVDYAHRVRAREAKMSTRQAELLRCKGTFTDSGRHSDDWLFGGWSFKDSVKGAWRFVRKGNE